MEPDVHKLHEQRVELAILILIWIRECEIFSTFGVGKSFAEIIIWNAVNGNCLGDLHVSNRLTV